ncbi:MAG TPA: ABC transporter permease [Vicinamibacterales bacterium]|nr:ABC transporter permease [Vicinamibacterales bacterium]
MPDFVAHVRRHLSTLDVPEGRYDEVVDELASELEARYAALVQRGATDEDAWNAALAQIPSWSSLAHDLAVATGTSRVRGRHHSKPRVFLGVDRWLGDLRLAARVLWKDRGFTVTAIVTLTICLGGHAAIVAGVNAVLLHPLRTAEPDRVLLMANQYPLVETRRATSSATPDYEDRLRHVTVFEEQALYNYSGAAIEIGGVPTRTVGIVATPSLFRLLRVVPAHGRIFTESEGTTGNDERIILSDGLWRDLYGGDPTVLGRTLRLTGRDFTIVGILPPGFSFGGPDIRFWIPLALTARQRSDEARHSNGWMSIGRLKPGATIAQVEAHLKALDGVNMERTSPQLKPILINTGFHTSAEPLQDVLVRNVKGSLYVLWGAALAVLVIGLGNLANLALARSRTRLSELGTRLALGAGRFDVVRQQLVEGLLICVSAAVGALALGAWMLSALRTRELVTAPAIQIDATVASITVGLVLREGLGLAAGGTVLGVLGSLALGRALASQLYGIRPSDPWVMLLMTVTLCAVAAVACIVPARRAAQVDVTRILSAP